MVTPEEFAEAHGLELEEARWILAKRAARSTGAAVANRLQAAKAALEAAQRKTGVHPVEEGYSDDLVRREDPEAEDNLQRFYQNKGGSLKTSEEVRKLWTSEDGGLDE